MSSFTKNIFRCPLIVAFILVTCSINCEAAIGKKLPFIIITVDVETTYHDNGLITMPDQLNAICFGNIQCGLNEIVRLLRAKGYGATFFLNVYEYKKYGEPSLKKIAKWLNASGQDVELHTHPQWAYDQNRNMMYQYSLQEQVNIIKDGKELLQKWTGQPVVAHRAGAYSADENTLKALIENNIFYDSSLFYGWPDSKINSLELKRNAVSLYGTLLEFPVTVYKRDECPIGIDINIEPISEIRKYDINWFTTYHEAELALTQAISSNLDFVILFLHSYSFIKGRNKSGEMVADNAAIRVFDNVLKLIRQKGLKVDTFSQIVDKKGEFQYLNKTDVIPEISVEIKTIPYFLKLIGINKSNYKIVVLFSAVSVFLLVVILINLFRKRRLKDA